MFYSITGTVVKTSRRWKGGDSVVTHQIPTFFLDADVQGITSVEHAIKIALSILDPFNLSGTKSERQIGGDSNFEVAFNLTAVPVHHSEPADVLVLANNGTLEFDRDENVIRYVDCDGNCEDIYREGDENWNIHRPMFKE